MRKVIENYAVQDAAAKKRSVCGFAHNTQRILIVGHLVSETRSKAPMFMRSNRAREFGCEIDECTFSLNILCARAPKQAGAVARPCSGSLSRQHLRNTLLLQTKNGCKQ